MSSSRLPGKVLADINGTPMIEILLKRLSKANLVDEVIVAMSSDQSDDVLKDSVASMGYRIFRGSINDVRSRYLEIARTENADCIVRITGDCPLVDPKLVDKVISTFLNAKVDYVSNINPPTYPDGLDIEVFSAAALAKSASMSKSAYDKEHVTPNLRTDKFSQLNVTNEENLSNLRWTVDTVTDLEVVTRIFSAFPEPWAVELHDVVELCKKYPEIYQKNQMTKRNEGATMGDGQKLWERAKAIIPGGNMLLSKRAEMFLPGGWPAYFSKSRGVFVWDLDNKKYVDMATMGVGTNLLGYRNKVVDNAVKRAINMGTMSTLNCPEEVELAERLVKLNPWAEMVKLARTGGEANAIAIRIARAASGRDKVAICGYHGWHDWYLSANLSNDKNLDGHLLPGLEPSGVPRALAGSVEGFRYNDIEALRKIVNQGDVGVIKMEVFRNEEPKDNFLQKVRDIATEKGIVLIFDECTSGFRETKAGLHEKYSVTPDIAVYGKALGNGYPITAVVGRRSVMDAAQSTFISSTFWTDRIGPTAALATLNQMEKEKSWEKVTELGKYFVAAMDSAFRTAGIGFHASGLPSLSSFSIGQSNHLGWKTLLTQEMLKRGYLASNAFYLSTAHSEKIIDKYVNEVHNFLERINKLGGEEAIPELLEFPKAHTGFSRLN